MSDERIIQRFAFWEPETWAIPKLYWDAFSQEQRIHAICKQLSKVIGYADYLGTNTDDIAQRLKAIEDGQLDPYIIAEIEQWFEDNQPAIVASLTALEEALPITDFDSENTVSDAIGDLQTDVQTLNGKFPIETADIADDAITGAKIDDGTIDSNNMGAFYANDISGLQSQIDTIRNKDIDERTYFYVDSVNGDDSNDGLTSDTAFKTFRRAMQIREEGYTDINLRFLPGVYYNYDWRWTNMSCHIIPHPDAVLHMAPNNLFNVYNCYIHFERMSGTGLNYLPKITFDNGIHTDSSSLFCQNVEFVGGTTEEGNPKRIDCYMSSSTFIDCTYNHINFLLRNGVYSISGGNVTNNDSKVSRISCQNALIGIYNLEDTTSSLDENPTTDVGYVDLQYCHASLYFDNNMAIPGAYKYPYFLRSRFSTVEMTNASYQRVIANSVNASGVTGHSSLIHAKTTLDIVT